MFVAALGNHELREQSDRYIIWCAKNLFDLVLASSSERIDVKEDHRRISSQFAELGQIQW